MIRKHPSTLVPQFPRAALLTASLGLIGCAIEPADDADADAVSDDDSAAIDDDAALPGFARATVGPIEAPLEHDERIASRPGACPEGQECDADLTLPRARGFALAAADAPRRAGPAAREDHSARKRVVAAADLGDRYKNAIDVKFVEGSGIRARDGRATIDAAAVRGAAPNAALAELRAELGRLTRATVVPMHTVDEATLDAWKRDGEQATGEALPDLNLWQQVFVEVDSDEQLADLVNALNRLPIVELAEATPLPAPPTGASPEEALAFAAAVREHDRLPWPAARTTITARTPAMPVAVEPAPPAEWMQDDEHTASAPMGELGFSAPTPGPSAVAGNYAAMQTYGGAAPLGMDVDYLRGNYWNAWGDAWGYTDVEYNWNQSHLDLGAIAGSGALVNGTPALVWIGTQNARDHGTGVVGVLSSSNNGVGTTGLVPNAMARLSTEASTAGTHRAAAISAAAAQYWRGSVVLLEMQTYAGFDCNGDGLANDGDLVPAEWNSPVKDVIKTAVANGRIVVAAAGNGNCNLDHAGFGGAFAVGDASKDSGAIIVGAGTPNGRDKEWFSSFGARVDVQGQGSNVTTTGYGDLFGADGPNAHYTSWFNGTSSASPMVTGVAVALAGVLWEYHGSIFDPREMRDLLRRDGSAQGSGGHIGPRPDLRKQIVHMHNRHVQMNGSDFDGDGKADYAVWRPSTGVWWIYYSGTGATAAYQWGGQGDIPVPANMTGDARAELVVYRPSNGTWHIRRWDGSSYSVQWGQNGDIPVPMDHDGDGLAVPAVFRQANMGGTQWSRWHIRDNDWSYTWFDWGEQGDVPLVGDFDADGRDDFAVFRGTTGMWYLYQWTGQTRAQQWGTWGDIPMIDKVGWREHIAVWRPTDGTFYRYNLLTNQSTAAQWGAAGEVPRLADTDGDGTSERIIYNPRLGNWYNLEKWWGLHWGEVGDMAVMR